MSSPSWLAGMKLGRRVAELSGLVPMIRPMRVCSFAERT